MGHMLMLDTDPTATQQTGWSNYIALCVRGTRGGVHSFTYLTPETAERLAAQLIAAAAQSREGMIEHRAVAAEKGA